MPAHQPWDPQAYIRHYDEVAAELGAAPFPAGDGERLRKEEEDYAYLATDGTVTTLRRLAELACGLEHNRATQEPWDEEKFIRCYNAIAKRGGGWRYEETTPGQSLRGFTEAYRGGGGHRTIEEFARVIYEYEQCF